MLHQEADGIPTAATAKTFVDFFGGGNGKGWRFLVVERTETEVIDASFFQLHKTADDIDNVDTALNLLYGLFCNQIVLYQDLSINTSPRHRIVFDFETGVQIGEKNRENHGFTRDFGISKMENHGFITDYWISRMRYLGYRGLARIEGLRGCSLVRSLRQIRDFLSMKSLNPG